MLDALAIVMARGGSKRVPRKNVRPFCGRPMVAWTVAGAKRSNLFSEIVISTDDRAIADAAVAEGAVCHGLRPAALCDDFSGTEDVLAYELESRAKRMGAMPGLCCCLYGTSVFVSPAILHEGLKKIAAPEIDLVMAVIPYSHPIERALVLTEAGTVVNRQPECFAMRTQDLPQSFYDAGLFYWIKPGRFMAEGKNSFGALSRTAVVMDAFDAVDIDTEEDWARAEYVAQCKGFVR